jgi:uncharacterized membrane protein
MLDLSTIDVPTIVALFLQSDPTSSSVFHFPTGADLARTLLRWSHFVAGILWIGLLYFFNLVNVPLMKKLDGPTKGKVVPELLPRALWYFRWGAVVTVLVGLTYYAMYILAADAHNAGMSTWWALGKWSVVVLFFWAVMFVVLTRVNWAVGKGPILAVVLGCLTVIMLSAVVNVLGIRYGGRFGNKTVSIGVGGGMGVIMLLNVWGIIWPAQKRIIAWTKANAEEGTAIPPESAKLARQAFLASRTNAWLSLPMLFFMGTSHGDYIWFGR